MEAEIYQILRENGYNDEELDVSFDVGEAGSSNDMSATYENMLLSLRKDELKSEAKKRNLSLTGNKIDLVKRILHNLESGLISGSGDNGTLAAEVTKPKTELNTNAGKVRLNPQMANGDSNNSVLVSSAKKRTRTVSQTERLKLKEERESLVLWKHPITTINYSVRELLITLSEWGMSLLQHKMMLLLLIVFLGMLVAATKLEGPYKEMVESWEKYILWLLWWVGLGVLSSVGLGTGLHTFLIYLGPHIAQVTLAAYECGTTDFPSPPYPDNIICPDGDTRSSVAMSIWAIMSKVRIESFCWGVGTALGELPPYFMARAHRLSGYDPDDDEEDEFLELQQKDPNTLNTFDRAKLGIERLVERVGFFGILACASIPNPLFDLAGITCGHFLVPFWTFFGATVIGKAVIKMHIQKLFIIFAFNETLIEAAVSQIHRLPWIGNKLEVPLRELLNKQKEKLHRKSETPIDQNPGVLGFIFEKLVLAMILYFLLSIVNSLAQSYHKRLHKKKQHVK